MPVDEAIHARHVTREGVRLEPAPIVVYDKPGQWSESLRMSVAGANVVLAWQEAAGTMVLRWNGAPGGERLVDSRSRALWSLADIAAVPNGDVDLYWSAIPVHPNRSLHVVHSRLRASDASLSGETIVTPSMRPGFELHLDAAVTSGGLPFLAYVRLANEPRYGGVERVFFVEGYAHAGRRRAVRS